MSKPVFFKEEGRKLHLVSNKTDKGGDFGSFAYNYSQLSNKQTCLFINI